MQSAATPAGPRESPVRKQASRESRSAHTFLLYFQLDWLRIWNLNLKKQPITAVKYFSQASNLIPCRTPSGFKFYFLYMNTHSRDIYRIIHLYPTELCFALLCAWLVSIGRMLTAVYGKW